MNALSSILAFPKPIRSDYAEWVDELAREISERTECGPGEVTQAVQALQRIKNALDLFASCVDVERDRLRIATANNAMSPTVRLRDVIEEVLLDELDLIPEAAHLLASDRKAVRS